MEAVEAVEAQRDKPRPASKQKRRQKKVSRVKPVKASRRHTAPTAAFNRASGRINQRLARLMGMFRFSIKLRIALAHVALLSRKAILAATLTLLIVGLIHADTYASRFSGAAAAIASDIEVYDADVTPEYRGIRAARQSDFIIYNAVGVTASRIRSDQLEDMGRDRAGWVDIIAMDSSEGIAISDPSNLSAIQTINPASAVPALTRLHLLNGWAFEWQAQTNLPRFRPATPFMYVSLTRNGYRTRLDVTDSIELLVWSGFVIALYWLISGIAVLRRGQRVSARLLAPISHIASAAENLSEHNLSMRINVDGTSHELRNLAAMVNGMLDRIESAYNRQKQFVSDASHELRTPIAVVQGYADLLARWGKDAPDVRDESIKAIQNETRSMRDLIENLLYLARHDKGTLKLNPEPFSVVELIQEAVKETILIAREHHIGTGGLEDCALTADRSAVKQALRIFLDNAVKYTPSGGYISVSCRVTGRDCSITVRDTGMGIAKADLPRVFDRFYRSDSARTQQIGGHGLGLSIARIVAASHGGKLHVASQPGKGSAFTITLPLR